MVTMIKEMNDQDDLWADYFGFESNGKFQPEFSYRKVWQTRHLPAAAAAARIMIRSYNSKTRLKLNRFRDYIHERG